ncbi:MAG TPA: hypothetical protein VJB57_06535 [Dehalococcoidia bacterium]|nr:hypothetical protein [Dehalococcoidia bacterium]
MTWQNSGPTPTALGWYWLDATCTTTVLYTGHFSLASQPVAPGGTGTFTAQLPAPPSSGNYCIRLELAHLYVGWFSAQGVPSLFLKVSVSGPINYTWSVRRSIPVLLDDGAARLWL